MIYANFVKERREEPVICFCARDKDLRRGRRYGPVIRDVYILECCTGGFGSAIINGKEFPVKKGDCYFLMPGDVIIHTTDEKEPRSGVWCAINGLQVGHALSKAGITSESPFAPKAAFEEITKCVEEMILMSDDNDAGANFRRTALIYEVLGSLLKHSSCNHSTENFVQRAIGIMEAQYHQPITVADLAGQIGLERSYFSTVFKNETGCSPHAYLTSLRIQKVCALLDSENYSVSEAAEIVGLHSRNLARIFKRETGKTPLEYKNRNKKGKSTEQDTKDS